MLPWVCALGILSLSASLSCGSEFYYSHNIIRRSNECNLCFEKNCLTLDSARCDYYAEADSILSKDVEVPGGAEDAAKRKEVDDLVFDLVDKGLSNNMECIPYVSRYSNCNKENVCLDCKTCSCSPEGRWTCITTQPCHSQDPPLNVDHRVLVMIMEALTGNRHPKKTKRSATNNPTDTASTITLEKLSEWLYGVQPLQGQEHSPKSGPTEFTLFADIESASEIATTVTGDSVIVGLTTMKPITETTTIEDTDYVAFDEVLRSIAVDPKPYNRRKLLDDNVNKNQTSNFNHKMIDEDNVTDSASSDHLSDVINFMLDYDEVVTESTAAGATDVVIDLLPIAENLTNGNITEDNIIDHKDLDPIFFENTNDILQDNSLIIMKRDVNGQKNITAVNVVPTVTIIVNTTNTTTNNKTDEFPNLRDHILIPLNKIMSDKINELESLQRIKEDLLKFVKSNNLPKSIPKPNITGNTHFSIYNIAMATGFDVDLRRANPNRYEKYMLKLKSDIFAVLRTITMIQKYKNSKIPEDLKLLIHAMKRYVYKNQLVKKPKRSKLGGQKSFRRTMERTSRCERLSFKECIVQIIKVIDKDTPKFNALFPLSPGSKKIMKHVIKSYYINQHIMPGLRVHEPPYNLTKYLNSIGSKWQQVSAILIHSTPFASLHRMKLLHCTLTLDISKLHDAIGFIEFAHSRRMVSLIDKVNDDTLDRIDTGLSAIHNKILMLIKYYKRLPNRQITKQPRAIIKETTTKAVTTTTIKTPVEKGKGKKHSFIKHIRNLLKTSKNDIADLLHKKVPKSEIVKELAKKRLDEISQKRYGEYEDTMRRWQQNLELTSRLKRSVLDQFKAHSLKNIIPRYLRHKVNPRIDENQKNATGNATRKAVARKNKRKGSSKGSRRGRRSRNTTTSKLSKPASRKSRKELRPLNNRKSNTSKIITTKTH